MIRLENVSKSYKIYEETTFFALKDATLEIKEKEFISIIGASGSGKSTLMHMIGLLDKPSRGKIEVNNQDISKLNDDQISTLRSEFVGFVFQQFNLIPKLNVIENILLPTIYARKKLEFDTDERARYLMKRFGLESKETSRPNKLSGGQQKRVAIARALIMNPLLILADEPTGNLDTKTGDEIIKLFQELNTQDKVTIAIVTHEPDVAAKAKRIIRI